MGSDLYSVESKGTKMNLIVPLLLLGTILCIEKVHTRSLDGKIEARSKITKKNLLKKVNKALKAAGVNGKLQKLLNGMTEKLKDLKDDIETNAENIDSLEEDVNMLQEATNPPTEPPT